MYIFIVPFSLFLHLCKKSVMSQILYTVATRFN